MTPLMRQITQQVAEKHGFTFEDMVGRSSRFALARARHEAMWLIRQERRADGTHRHSFPMIGAAFERDHTSVMYACRRHEERMAARR